MKPTPMPDARGYFGSYGGRFVPETIMTALEELERETETAFADPSFHSELEGLLRDFVGRPSPLFLAKRAEFVVL